MELNKLKPNACQKVICGRPNISGIIQSHSNITGKAYNTVDPNITTTASKNFVNDSIFLSL